MKLIQKYFDGNVVQRNDATTVNVPIITNIPLDNSSESKFYQDLLAISPTKESEDYYNFLLKAHDTGTVAPYDVRAHEGEFERKYSPKSGHYYNIWHRPTTTNIETKSEGQRMWESPALQLASAPFFDVLFALKGFSKVPTKLFDFTNYQATPWYRRLVKKFGQEQADRIVMNVSNPSFEQQFLGGRSILEARKTIEDYKKMRAFNDAFTNNGALLSGSPAVALEGSIERVGILPHDLDYTFQIGNMSPNASLFDVMDSGLLTFDNIKNSGILQSLSKATGKPVNLYRIPEIFKNHANLYKAIKGKNNLFFSPMLNYKQGLGANRALQGNFNGIDLDIFASATKVPVGSVKGAVPAQYPLGWKKQFMQTLNIPREKDMMDLYNYGDYGPLNWIIDKNKGQWSPFSFSSELLEGRLPNVQAVEIYPGANEFIPAVMNLNGELVPVGKRFASGKGLIQRFPGFQIKSLLPGNPLEQQLSQKGTIAVNNIRQYMTHRSKMDQDIVNSVLRQNVFDGLDKIDYNAFRKAVQDNLLDIEGSVWSASRMPRDYTLGHMYGNGGKRRFSVEGWTLYNYDNPDRATAFGNALEEARLKKLSVQIKEEIKNLKTQLPEGINNSYHIYVNRGQKGVYPPNQQYAIDRIGELMDQMEDLMSRLRTILNTSGGSRYLQVKHLKQDYTTKLIQKMLLNGSRVGYKQLDFPNTSVIMKRLQKMNLNPIIENDRIVIEVPKDYYKGEIEFKVGGKIK